MRVYRRTQFVLQAFAVTFAAGTVVAWILVPWLVESAYEGTSWSFFNNIIMGQGQHPLQFYLEIVRHLLLKLSIYALVVSVLTMSLCTERGRHITALMLQWILPAIALLWVIIRAMPTLDLYHFGDEDEKIVAAWLISEGERLYGSIFAHHGPLNYMISHAVYVVTESKELAPYRIAHWIIIGLGSFALAASPVLLGWRQRIYAASSYLILAAILYPQWLGHVLLYHVHGGVLFTMALSLLFLPLILGVRIPNFAAGIAGSAMVAMVAAAYPFAVPLFFMIISTSLLLLAQHRLWQDTKELIIPVVLGGLLMFILVMVWVVLNGDPVGYFVYHFYFNQEVYAPFIHFDPLLVFKQLGSVGQPRVGWALWIVLILILWLVISISTRQRKKLDWRARIFLMFGAVALLVAFLYLNPRSEESFKMAALQVASVSLISIAVARGVTLKSNAKLFPVWQIALSFLFFFLIYATQFTMMLGSNSASVIAKHSKQSAVQSKAAQATIDLVQSWVGPSESIQAIVFNPQWYLLTHRRPASGHYYYLPWQAAYSNDPILGKNIDICADLESVQPEVIIWDHQKIWQERYDIKNYEPCVYELITTQYEPVEDMPELMRRIRR